MFSRFRAASQLSKPLQLRLRDESYHIVIGKRWSGHNAMEIKPTTTDWLLFKNWTQFYLLLGLVPMTIITTYVNIRANPELSEVPDGYEPRFWEYYKHPITRWLAKNFFDPRELDEEIMLGYQEVKAENKIIGKVIDKAEKVMKFYHDHRSMYFRPYFADPIRIGREDSLYLWNLTKTDTNLVYDKAYDPNVSIIPVEGYPDGPVSKD